MDQKFTKTDVYSIAEIVAFLYAGAIQHPTLGNRGEGMDLDSWSGHTGFVGHCTGYALAIDQWLTTRSDEFPGVFVYELIEPMGEWLIEKFHNPPEVAEVLDYFKVEFLAWINKDE
jgi:hypothetical protein